ncbi:MAG: [FeFe] hydrogenase, group A [Acidaminococcales bacterium]|jgi:NADH-quinone oxidoreductase subunit G/NADP-reducing hydrogenase subunit HndD|nr:[FeFe] hydrogenase, group A [Acidaminococcales bacterium]
MNTDMVNVTIDGRKVSVHKSASVLNAANKAGIKIPTLCYHPELRPEGACRICMVEVEGARTLVASCAYPVNEGMIVRTNTEAVRHARRSVVELMLANHPSDCLACVRNKNCELQNVAAELGLRKIRFDGEKKKFPLDANNPSLVRDNEKCILCGRCVRVCSERQGVHVYSFTRRGFNTVVSPAFDAGLDEAACTYCGQCSVVCPTAAITEKDDTEAVWKAISDPTKHVIIQTAPSVRVALGETQGLAPGAIVTGKMVAALRRMGFDKVFDTNFSADLTIMEEGNEFVHRLKNGGKLPMVTSCSPGWVNLAEIFYPDLLGHLSTAKSPQQMFGAVVKTYYAEKSGIDPKNIVSVSAMPCTAKKAEAMRPQMRSSGYQDVDIVITTRELGRMIKEAGIDFAGIGEEEFDAPMDIGSGAGAIFGATGGVMEAALRTAYELLTGEELKNLDFDDVRGLKGLKEATVDIAGVKVKVAVANTLGQARQMMERVRAQEAPYHFIEIMACPGGCISGGGQPVPVNGEIRMKRHASIYEIDQRSAIRKSHENPAIKTLYSEWLGQPLGEKAHKLLHTHYHPQYRGI